MALIAQAELEPDRIAPDRIVMIADFSKDTLRNVIAHLEVSTEFDHLIYRESELDAIWTLTDRVVVPNGDSDSEAVARLHEGVHAAHDLVAANCPKEAADILRRFL